MNTITVTFRGWAGHFCAANDCRFKLNSLVEYNGKKVVISTVGLLDSPASPAGGFSTLDGARNYFETLLFWAKENDKFNDADVSKQIFLDEFKTKYKSPDMELIANDNHYKAIELVSKKLLNGEL